MRLDGMRALVAAMPLWLPAVATAADVETYKTVDGLAVYLGVVPAAMVQGHDADHPEAEMHGGVPRGVHANHVMVAVFDAESGERIEDAAVEAEVSTLGSSHQRELLEPMLIANAVTYGNYFTMQGDGRYEIRLSITRPGIRTPTIVEFNYEHFTR